MSYVKRVLSNQFIRPALRFAIAMLIADGICIGLLHDDKAAPYCSFAVVVLLYFLDFDGRPWMRVRALLVASIVGALCVVIGTFAAITPVVAVLATIPIAFAFSYSRVLKGFVARSAVGLMIAYAIPVMQPAHVADLGHYLGGWALGSAIAIIAALVILPKYAIVFAQRDIAAWCRIAAQAARAMGTGESGGNYGPRLLDAIKTLRADTIGAVRRPGATSPRLRALLEMGWHMNAGTLTAMRIGPLHTDAHATALNQASATALEAAAGIVDHSLEPKPAVDMNAARHADLVDVVTWTQASLPTDPGGTVDALAWHYPSRLMSMLADSLQWLALTSRGVASQAPDLGVVLRTGPADLLRSNFTHRSPWFRNAIRAGIGAAAAVALVEYLGLLHGFWVLLATISLMQVTFSSAHTGTAALRTAAGGVLGVLGGAAVIFGLQSTIAYFVVLIVFAFGAKWANARFTIAGQALFTTFAIVNVTLLNWPPSIVTAESRFIDLMIGLVVAVLLTFVLFPRGIGRLISSSDAAAKRAVANYLRAARAAVAGHGHDQLPAHRRKAVRAILEFSDSIDAVYIDSSGEQDDVTSLSRDEALQHLGILAADAMRNLMELTKDVPVDPKLTALVELDSDDRLAHLRSDVVSRPADQLPDAREVIGIGFTCWWLDFLDHARQSIEHLGADAPSVAAAPAT